MHDTDHRIGAVPPLGETGGGFKKTLAVQPGSSWRKIFKKQMRSLEEGGFYFHPGPTPSICSIRVKYLCFEAKGA